MRHGGLQHAVEGQGLERVVGLVARDLLEILIEVELQPGLEDAEIHTAVAQDLGAGGVVDHRVEDVLDRHVGVPAHRGLAQGRLQHHSELTPDLAHSSSTPARRG